MTRDEFNIIIRDTLSKMFMDDDAIEKEMATSWNKEFYIVGHLSPSDFRHLCSKAIHNYAVNDKAMYN